MTVKRPNPLRSLLVLKLTQLKIKHICIGLVVVLTQAVRSCGSVVSKSLLMLEKFVHLCTPHGRHIGY